MASSRHPWRLTARFSKGALPARSTRLVREWALLHQAELERNWQLARDRQPLDRIEPLA
jgi:hypothetical protein